MKKTFLVLFILNACGNINKFNDDLDSLENEVDNKIIITEEINSESELEESCISKDGFIELKQKNLSELVNTFQVNEFPLDFFEYSFEKLIQQSEDRYLIFLVLHNDNCQVKLIYIVDCDLTLYDYKTLNYSCDIDQVMDTIVLQDYLIENDSLIKIFTRTEVLDSVVSTTSIYDYLIYKDSILVDTVK